MADDVDKPPIGPPYTAWGIYDEGGPMKFAELEPAQAWCREKRGRFIVTRRVHEGIYG